jgi:hypothetical protein
LKLLVNNGVVELVQALVLCHFLPNTVPVIMIGNGILMLSSPQKVFQNQKGITIKAKFTVQPY